MSQKHIKPVRNKFESTLETKIDTPLSSAWFPQVIIAMKKDEKHRFCVDYRARKWRMKLDCFLLPKVLEVSDKIGKWRVLYDTGLPYGVLTNLIGWKILQEGSFWFSAWKVSIWGDAIRTQCTLFYRSKGWLTLYSVGTLLLKYTCMRW